jgi:hypothetical protein
MSDFKRASSPSSIPRRGALLLCVASLAGAAGCARVGVSTPGGFAELDAGDTFRYRASNSDGVVIAVRREKNDPKGDLAFWSGAVDAQLRRAGYQATEGHDVEARGLKGKQIRYTITRAGREHAYWINVFVTERSVVTVEAGGDKELFAREEDAIKRTIASLEIG